MMWLILLSSLFLVIYVFYKIRFTYWKRRGIPNPEPTFLFGNVLEVFLGRKSLGDCLTEIYQQYEGYPCVGFFKGSAPSLLIRDPEFIKAITVKDFQHFVDIELAADKESDPIVGRNPLFLKGQEWKTVRAQLTTCFTGGKMKYMFPLMMTVTKNMNHYIYEKITEDPEIVFELKELCSRYTIDTVAICAFDLDGKCFEQENSKMRGLARRFLSAGTLTSMKINLLVAFPWIGKYMPIKFVSKDVDDELQEMVKATLKFRDENKIDKQDFLGNVSSLKQTCTAFEFTDVDVTAHAATFIADGYETSSSAMSFVLFDLAQNYHIQVRLREEIEETLEKCGGEFTFEAISDMIYLNAIIQESMRKNSLLPGFNRVCTKEYTYHSQPTDDLKGITVKIEKGIVVSFPTYGLAHDPKYFDEPEKFDPDRFLDEKNSFKYISLPFGEGPRSCLGRRFALLQVKLGVAQLIRNFEFRVNAKTKLPLKFDPMYFMLSPIGGLWVNVYKMKK